MKRFLCFWLINLAIVRWLIARLLFAESSLFWTTGTTGDGASTYTEAQTTAFFGDLCTPNTTITNPHATRGIFPGAGGELAVSGTSSPVSVASGAAVVEGYAYHNTAAVTVAIPTPAGATRIDRIVLRVSHSPTRTVRITRIAGTEGTGSAPAITQVAGTTWDIKLVQASITTGGVITLTDERDFVHLATRLDKNQVDGMTATRIPFADTNGRLTDDAGLTYNATSDLLSVTGSEVITNTTSGNLNAFVQTKADGASGLLVGQTPASAGGALPNSAGVMWEALQSSDIVFGTSGTSGSGSWIERMRIASAGNIGIGVAAPGYALDVVGQARISPGSALPPLVLGANAIGQKVTGLNADQVDGLDLAFNRQGGSATDWSTQGTNNYTPTAIRRQAGRIRWTGAAAGFGNLTLTFPVAFSQPPVVLGVTPSDPVIAYTPGAGSATQLSIFWSAVGATTYTSIDFYWAVEGPI